MDRRTAQCTGCEMECQVEVTWHDGAVVSVEGNTCPTGESYARAVTAERETEEQHDEKTPEKIDFLS